VRITIPRFGTLQQFVNWWQKLLKEDAIKKDPQILTSIAAHAKIKPWLDKFSKALEQMEGDPSTAEVAQQLLTLSGSKDLVIAEEVLRKYREQAKRETMALPSEDKQLPAFGRYQIKRKIAEGGFGAVYEAYDPQLDRTVALKLLKLRTELEIEQFEKEAKLAASLRHPNIISVHELGVLDGQPYFTMDFIEGKTVRDLLYEKGRIPVQEAFRIAAVVADALAFAHSSGIVHRDMKPENVFTDKQGRIYVGDFGIAKQVTDAGGQVTSSRVVGTPHYMSPEQANGENLDARSDIWAVGVMLYELLCGTCPFVGRAVVDIFKKIWFAEPISLRKLNQRVGRDANTIVAKCLEKEPDRRYASAAELKDDIERYLRGEPIHARPIGALEKSWRRIRRNKAASFGIAAALVAVIAVVIVLLLQKAAKEAEQKANRDKATRVFEDAKDAFKGENYEKALELVSRSLALHSDDLEAQELKEKCSQNLEDIKKARDAVTRGIGETDPDKAVALIGSALSVMKDDWYAQQQYGLALERCGRTDEALEAFRKAAKLALLQNNSDGRIESLYRVALIFWNKQEHEEGERVARKVEQLTGERKTVATLTLKAMIAARNNKDKEALELAQEAFEMDKSNVVVLFTKANALSYLGLDKEAIEAYSRCIWEFDRKRNVAWLVWCYNNRGNARSSIRDYDGAIADYTETIRLRPTHAHAYINRGNAKKGKGNYEGAIADYDQAIRLDPNNAGAFFNRGSTKASVGDYDGAVADYSQALRLRPDDAGAFCLRGNAKRNSGDLDGAIEDYARAIQVDPKCSDAYYQRGRLKARRGDLNGAMDDYTEAIKANPKHEKAYFSRGNIRDDLGDINGAIADYTETIKLNPKHAGAFNNRGNARFSQRNFDGAISDFSQAIRINPGMSAAYNNRGLAFARKGDFDRALSDYNKALQLNPNDPAALSNRAMARVEKKDFAGAIADLTAVVRLEPNNYTAYNNRGSSKAESGDPDGTIADYTRAIQLNPNYTGAYCNRANTRRSKGDFDGALADAAKALEITPNYWRGWFSMTMAYSEKRDKMRCLETLRRAINANPKVRSWAVSDEVFEWLRDDPEFQRLTSE
jgi:tetratricopeptide (TPR) repeat protein